MTADDLDAIEARAKEAWPILTGDDSWRTAESMAADHAALVAEVRRLRSQAQADARVYLESIGATDIRFERQLDGSTVVSWSETNSRHVPSVTAER